MRGFRPSAVAALLVAAGTAALAWCQISDPDFGFHLATGRHILATGHIPTTNVFSFAEPEHPWLLHEGLPAVALELAHRWGGVWGVLGLKTAILVATFMLSFRAAVRLGAAIPLAAAVTLLGAFASSFRFVERPFLFSNLALAAVVYCLAGAHRPGGRRWPWLLAAAVAAAAGCNLHAGAVFAILLLLLVAITQVAGPVVRRLLVRGARESAAAPEGMRAGLAVAAAAAAAAALAALALSAYHPLGARVLLVPFAIRGDSFLAGRVNEFLPMHVTPLHLTWPFWLLLVSGGVVLTVARRRLPLPCWAAFAMFAAMAVLHTRFADAFALVASPIIACGLTHAFPAALARPAGRLGWLLAAGIALTAPIDNWSRRPPVARFNPSSFPEALFGTVHSAGLTGHAFVSDAWAGPWLAAFYPPHQVFFFPTFEAFSPRFYREEYLGVRDGQPGWDAKLDRHGIEVVVLRYTTARERERQGGADNLRQQLAADRRWALISFDDHGEVFVRRDGINRDAAARLAIRGVDPDRGTVIAAPEVALASLASARPRLPGSRRLDEYLRLLGFAGAPRY